jgi:hypothetical protein
LLRNRQETRAVLALKMESLGIVPEPIAAPASLIQEPAVAAAPAQQPSMVEDENTVETAE